MRTCFKCFCLRLLNSPHPEQPCKPDEMLGGSAKGTGEQPGLRFSGQGAHQGLEKACGAITCPHLPGLIIVVLFPLPLCRDPVLFYGGVSYQVGFIPAVLNFSVEVSSGCLPARRLGKRHPNTRALSVDTKALSVDIKLSAPCSLYGSQDPTAAYDSRHRH